MELLEYDVTYVTNKTFNAINKKLKFTHCIMLQNIGNQYIWVSDGTDFGDDNEGWLIQPGDTFKSNTGVVYVKPGVNKIKVTVQGTPNG